MTQAAYNKKYARNPQEPYLNATCNKDRTASGKQNTNATSCSADYWCDWTAAALI